MDEIQKMLRSIINSQSAFRQEVLKEITEVKKETKANNTKIDLVRKELHESMDTLGTQLAYLEDDAPTREEFDKLDNRITKLEHQKTSTFS